MVADKGVGSLQSILLRCTCVRACIRRYAWTGIAVFVLLVLLVVSLSSQYYRGRNVIVITKELNYRDSIKMPACGNNNEVIQRGLKTSDTD